MCMRVVDWPYTSVVEICNSRSTKFGFVGEQHFTQQHWVITLLHKPFAQLNAARIIIRKECLNTLNIWKGWSCWSCSMFQIVSLLTLNYDAKSLVLLCLCSNIVSNTSSSNSTVRTERGCPDLPVFWGFKHPVSISLKWMFWHIVLCVGNPRLGKRSWYKRLASIPLQFASTYPTSSAYQPVLKVYKHALWNQPTDC